MKCNCCGKEISSSDRYCKNCGQNNPNYIEPKEVEVLNDNLGTSFNPKMDEPTYQKQIYVYNAVEKENCAIGVLSLIFGILGGWLGLLLGIIGLCKYKETGNRVMCWLGLGIYVFWMILYIIIFINIR